MYGTWYMYGNKHIQVDFQENKKVSPPAGVIEVYWYMTGSPRYFFGLKIYMLGIFLGQEICHVFFWVVKIYVYFLGSYLHAKFSCRVFVAISGSEKYSFELFFSDVCSCTFVILFLG